MKITFGILRVNRKEMAVDTMEMSASEDGYISFTGSEWVKCLKYLASSFEPIENPGAFVWFEKTQVPLVKVLPVPGWWQMTSLGSTGPTTSSQHNQSGPPSFHHADDSSLHKLRQLLILSSKMA
ncbi:hypothetical protein TNCV_4382471 [Trichonephila clavipes]|nr:hypothetical protein TNCV_4382471 [Trichonephila clavipes]